MTAPIPAPPNTKFVSPGKRQAENEVRIAGETMKRIEEGDNYRMPERVFVIVFLNFFHSGQIDKRYIPAHCEDGLDTWISIVGNGLSEVDVIDQAGNVIYTVPAVSNRLSIRSQFNSSKGIAQDIRNAELYSTYSENHSTMFLEAALAKRALLNIDGAALTIEAERWNSIYSRYGLEKITTARKESSSTGTVKTESKEANYDEWEQA